MRISGCILHVDKEDYYALGSKVLFKRDKRAADEDDDELATTPARMEQKREEESKARKDVAELKKLMASEGL